jgi:hypothetical protein
MMKKWYWALGVTGIIIAILIILLFIVLHGGDGSVSNIYLIPVGAFSLFHESNLSVGQGGADNSPKMNPAGSDIPDAWFDISEYKPDALKNRTLMHMTDEELDELPGLEKIFHTADSNTRLWSVIGQRYTGGFDGNMTRFYRFNKVICNNSPLDICFANPPLFEYNGRNFTISVDEYHSHTTAPPTLAVHSPAPVEKMVSIISVSRQQEDSIIHISGQTDLPAGSDVMYEIWPENIATRKKTVEDVEGISGRTTPSKGEGLTVWSIDMNLSVWRPGKYIINAWPEGSDPRYGDRKMFFIPLNDTVSNGLGKDSGTGEIILYAITPSEPSSLSVSITPKPTPDKFINESHPSSDFLVFMNAPAINQSEKDQCQRLITDSKGFEKFKDISHGPVNVVWVYPYAGKQRITTVIGSETSDTYGLYYAYVDPENSSILDDGFVDWKKYW